MRNFPNLLAIPMHCYSLACNMYVALKFGGRLMAACNCAVTTTRMYMGPQGGIHLS